MWLVEFWTAVTGVMAFGSFVVSILAYRRSGIRDLPPLGFGSSWRSGGQRGISFGFERLPGQPNWVVHSATVHRNWLRRCWLARGQEQGFSVLDDGEEVIHYGPDRPWRHRVLFDPPIAEGAVIIHPNAPTCRVTLKITLTTFPSPTIVRHIVSQRRD